jgi:hypothetical protein
MGTADDPWRMYAEERADVHDFLASLSPGQWAVPSLCAGWEVKDVAVHLLVDEPLRQLGTPRALIMAAQCRFSVHRMNQWWVERNRQRPGLLRRAVAAGTDQRPAWARSRRPRDGHSPSGHAPPPRDATRDSGGTAPDCTGGRPHTAGQHKSGLVPARRGYCPAGHRHGLVVGAWSGGIRASGVDPDGTGRPLGRPSRPGGGGNPGAGQPGRRPGVSGWWWWRGLLAPGLDPCPAPPSPSLPSHLSHRRLICLLSPTRPVPSAPPV